MLRFAVLGPLEVRRDGELVDLGPQRHVELLCLLLVRPRTVVSPETLAEELWDGRPPATAANTLQGYVAKLRRALEPDRAPREPARVLVTHPAGYRLDVPDDAIDVSVFRSAVTRARALAVDPANRSQAAATVRTALDLWRASALTDVADATWAVPVVRSLEEERLAAEELYVELSLADEDLADLVPRLQRLLAAHPLRERTAMQLMRALYRSGRQAEALAVARETRELLDAELGIDPSPELRDLELAVLRQDDAVLLPARRPEPPGEGARPGTLSGRGDELARILAAARQAQAGTAAAVLVTGEAGIGKTRLVEAAVAELGDFQVLTGRCSDLEGTPAYWPWRQVLTRLGAAQSAEVGESRFEQAVALADRLREEAERQPVAVVLDDLHWADVPSLELLELLLAELRDTRLLLVLTARGPATAPRLTRLLAALGRHPAATRLELGGLDDAWVGACILEVTGIAPSPELTATIGARSGGNPFFARELARLLDDDGRLASGVPTAVRDVLRLRTSALPGPAHDLLAAGAVLGRDFAVPTVEAMLELSPDEMVHAVEAGLAAGLLVEPLPGRLRFAHALVHEAVRADLSGARTTILHARAARALAEREQPPAGVLAHHLLHARDVAGVPAAAAAAAEDLRRLAVEPALELLDHASRVAEALPVAERQLAEVSLLRGIALARLGHLDESHGLLAATAEAAAARDDHEILARAALAMAADGTVTGYWTMMAPVSGDPDRVVGWLRRALATEEVDAETTAALRAALATQLAITGRPDPGLADAAVADARAFDAEARGRALTARWATLWTPEHAGVRLGIARELMDLAGRHTQRQLAARHLLTTALLETGDLAGSDAQFADLAEAVDRLRNPDFTLLVLWWRAMRALMSGDLGGAEDAAAVLQERLGDATGWAADTAAVSMGTVAGIVAWERGLLGHAAAQFDNQGFSQHPGMQAVRALAHAQHGNATVAHDILDRAFGRDLGRLGDEPMSISPLVLATEVLAVAGDGGHATPLLERLTPHAGSIVVFAPGAVCMGAGTLYTGTAAALAGDLDRARTDLQDAVARNDALGATPFTVRSLTRLASVLDRTGHADDAARRRAEAAELAARRGLTVAPFAG